MNTLFVLFLSFCKIGLFAVGGGLATLPFLTELSQQYPAWFASPTLADMVAIAESTPGPIGVNAATFSGFSAAGVPGALVATLSLVLPSFIIISVIAGALERYRSSKLVDDAFKTLRPTVAGLIGAAGFSMLRMAILTGDTAAPFLQQINLVCLLLFAVLLTLTQLKWTKKLHPIFIILLGALAGIIFC